MNVIMVIAPENFRDEEYFDTKSELENYGLTVHTASVHPGTCKSMFGKTANAEFGLNQINADNYAAIVFVGGAGTPTVRKEQASTELVKRFYEQGKVVAAICWAPTILAKAGVLVGKKATVWEGFDPEFNMQTEDYLENMGATYTGEDVEVDGTIITANGPHAAHKFGKTIAEMLLVR